MYLLKYLKISFFVLVPSAVGLMLFMPQRLSVVRASNNTQPASSINQSSEIKGKTDSSALINTYCISCHGPDKQKGKVRFDTLETLTPDDRNELFNVAHEAIHFKEMPPEDKPQPTGAERKMLLSFLSGQTSKKANAALKEKLRYPDYGNMVDHEALFDGSIDEPAYSPARRWLVSPQIFLERVIG